MTTKIEVTHHNPTHVSLSVFSDEDVSTQPGNYVCNGRLVMTWMEWQAFAICLGWTGGDIATCKEIELVELAEGAEGAGR